MKSSLYRHVAACALMFHGVCLMGMAQADDLPAMLQQDGVEYLSGGIGLDESTAVEAESRKWPLTLLFAVKGQQRAVYTSDAQVRIRDSHQRVLLQTGADGPFLLVRLVPGTYVVEATLQGKTLQQQILLKKGLPARVVFVWPERAGETGF